MNTPHPTKLVLETVDRLPEMQKAVVVKRFGLINGERRTLESVGEEYGITRERVRQIQEAAFLTITASEEMKRIEELFGLFHGHLKNHGDVRHEDRLLMNDAADLFEVKHDPQFVATVYFILTLGDSFHRAVQTPKYHAAWTVDKKSLQNVRSILDKTVTVFKKERRSMSRADLFTVLETIAKKHADQINEKILESYLELSKEIVANVYGEYGLREWPEIMPRSMKERAYLILKRMGKPLHFRDITKLINEHSLSMRPAYEATVHNDLIKDDRFVLCGRGEYALREWGYDTGTVKELISKFLEKSGKPKTKDEVVKAVLLQRNVKPNTIALNLNDKKLFKKQGDGKYALAR